MSTVYPQRASSQATLLVLNIVDLVVLLLFDRIAFRAPFNRKNGKGTPESVPRPISPQRLRDLSL